MFYKLTILLGLSSILLISTQQIRAEDDFESLYNRVFAQDAPVLEPSETLSLLEQIYKLRNKAEEKHTRMGSVEKLINLTKLDTDNCKTDRFHTYQFISKWNANIVTFWQAYEAKEWQFCRQLLVDYVAKMSQEDKDFADKLSGMIASRETIKSKYDLVEPVEQIIKEQVIAKYGVKFLSNSKLMQRFKEEYYNFQRGCRYFEDIVDDKIQIDYWLIHSYLWSKVRDDEFIEKWNKMNTACKKLLDISDIFRANGRDEFFERVSKRFQDNLSHKFLKTTIN